MKAVRSRPVLLSVYFSCRDLHHVDIGLNYHGAGVVFLNVIVVIQADTAESAFKEYRHDHQSNSDKICSPTSVVSPDNIKLLAAERPKDPNL